jgi:hypothetical protein
MVRTKDKYVGAIEKHRDRILEIHWLHQEKNPVLLFDVTEGKIYAYPYKKLKKELNTGGQVSLTKQYEEALRRDQFVLSYGTVKRRNSCRTRWGALAWSNPIALKATMN